MAENSKIEWTHHTFNPWRGCTKVSAGCANCYAETLSHRNPKTLGVWGDNGTRVVAAESYWKQPIKWNQAAKEAGERHRVFCASLADVFEDQPELDGPRGRLVQLIGKTPQLDWLLLTKRPENVKPLLSRLRANGDSDSPTAWEFLFGDGAIYRNVWLGVSVEDQASADERIPLLLQTPAAVRFLSIEPLLGPVDLRPKAPEAYSILGKFYGTGTFDPSGMSPAPDRVLNCFPKIDWVIVGGESGHHARPLHPDWARSIRDQCQAADVPFFFKQWGEWAPHGSPHDNLHGGLTPSGEFMRMGKLPRGIGRHHDHRYSTMYRVGKKAAGRLLDGREWSEFPAIADTLLGHTE